MLADFLYVLQVRSQQNYAPTIRLFSSVFHIISVVVRVKYTAFAIL